MKIDTLVSVHVVGLTEMTDKANQNPIFFIPPKMQMHAKYS